VLQLLLEGLQYLLQQIWRLFMCITGTEKDSLKDAMKWGLLALKTQFGLLGASAKLQKANISFVMSVCLPACLRREEPFRFLVISYIILV